MFKAILRRWLRQKKAEYIKKKDELISDLITGLQDLAKNRDIKDFNLDLSDLETQEGRVKMRASFEPLHVNHLQIVKKLANIQSEEILQNTLLKNAIHQFV